MLCGGVGAQEHSPVHYPTDEGSGQGPLCLLDNNQAHFILVEPGPPGKGDGLTELRLRLEKHISEQRTGYGGEACPGEVTVGGFLGGKPEGRGWTPRWAEGTEHAWEWRPGLSGGLGWEAASGLVGVQLGV